MSFPRYERYKDSGVEWLGEVPEHWQVQPARFVVRDIDKRNENEECQDYLSLMANIGVIPYAEKGDIGNKKPEDLSKCKLVEVGDIVINSMNYSIGSYGISPYNGVCSPVYIVLKVREEIAYRRFAFRIFQNSAFQRYAASFGNGILAHRAAIGWDDIKVIGVAVPSLKEQQKILTFLDEETAKIDALIEEQRRLIELLKEKRQAVISHAVTKGLNPNVPMKSSDVDWIGQVPGHWAVTRLGYFATVENGTTPSRENLEYWTDGQIPWLASGEVNQLNITEASEFITEQALAESSLRLLPEGTIVVGLVGQGKTRGMSAILRMTATINQNLAAICPGPKILGDYIVYLFQAMYESLREDGRGGNQAAINCKMLTSLQIPVPTISEQKVISAFLDKLTEETNTLESEADDAIRLLQERRSALISAAVTGKIDVRNYTPKEAA